MAADSFVAQWSEVKKMVYDMVDDMNGSFSAEHGAEQLKKNT